MQIFKYDTPEERLEYIKAISRYYTDGKYNCYSKEELIMALKQCYDYANTPYTSTEKLHEEIKTCCTIGSYSWANMRVARAKQDHETNVTFLIKKSDYPTINRWIYINHYNLDSILKIVETDFCVITISWEEEKENVFN